jgi:hypothetical protein
MEQKEKPYRKNKITTGFAHIRKVKVDINLIAAHMINKTIDAVDIVYGEDTMIMTLSDGSSVELIIDSIYMNIQEVDD